MTKDEDVDEVTGRSVAEMEQIAEDLYEHRDELGGDEVPAERVNEVRSVVSVRFSRGELDDIAAAAALAGQPLSTYIRNAALAAAGAVDLEAARRELHKAARAINELGRSLGTAA
jgi:uncharacterized protein (DUF1778 family)